MHHLKKLLFVALASSFLQLTTKPVVVPPIKEQVQCFNDVSWSTFILADTTVENDI